MSSNPDAALERVVVERGLEHRACAKANLVGERLAGSALET